MGSLEKVVVTQVVNTFSAFRESENTLQCSQGFATASYSELHIHTYFLRLILVIPSDLRLDLSVDHFR